MNNIVTDQPVLVAGATSAIGKVRHTLSDDIDKEITGG